MVRDTPWSKTSATWWILSVALVFCCLGWTFLSTQFQYGQGHAERPIIQFLVLYVDVWAVLVAGFLFLRRAQGKGPLVLIVLAGLIARAVLLPSNLIQENDVYRYVLDGQTLLDGSNPYRYAPLVISDLGPFRAIRHASYRGLGMRDRSWGWTVEMQILAVLSGLCMEEVSVSWDPRMAGVSKAADPATFSMRRASHL